MKTMSKYTQYRNKFVDNQIRSHLSLAIHEYQKDNRVVSAILVGGFSRAEGSVKVDKKEKTIRPLNDYDIYLLVNKSISPEEIETTNTKLEKILGSKGFSTIKHSVKDFYFDVRTIPLSKLGQLPPFIKYIEMKNSSINLFGPDLRSRIPEYPVSEIPPGEGLRFIYNRLSSIFIWAPTKYFKNKKIADWEKDVLLYDISKLYLACSTALCLTIDQFAPTYKGRLALLNKNWSKFSSFFPERIRQAINFYTKLKLYPDYSGIKSHRLRWFNARDDALKILKHYLNTVYQTSSINKKVSGKYFYPYLEKVLSLKFGFRLPRLFNKLAVILVQRYLNYKWIIRLKSNKKPVPLRYWLRGNDPGLVIFSSLVFLIESIKRDGSISKRKLERGYKILSQVFPCPKLKIISSLSCFEKVKGFYEQAWKLYFFMQV